MRGLFTADVQTDFSNLHICDQAWTQLVDYAVARKLEFICVAGDLKRAYNPVDVRVIHWWQRAIKKAKKIGLRVIVNLGNHDRLGQSDDQQSWLPILRRAGAEAFDRPIWVEVKDGRLGILPFRSNGTQRKTDAKELASEATDGDVLVFHGDLKDAFYNMTGARSDSDFSAKDLYPDKYWFCIGGHIHRAQTVSENVYYTGSMFCEDWGEANQKKSFMVVDGRKLTRVPSAIPGWYDDTWKGFPHDKTNWRGTNLRLHVEVPAGSDYVHILTRSREAAEAKYRGAHVQVVAEFEEKEQADVSVKLEDPDRVKIEQYVKAQKFEFRGEMVEYLMAKLTDVVGLQRAVTHVRFLSSSAKNFLSFKDVEIEFESGLTVVRGVNKDRGNGSNGSGKTSLLQILPVALFGMTFKEQKYDRWARRSTTEKAEVQIAFRDSRQREIRVTRTRRPGSLKFFVGGIDRSSGLRNDQKDATQGFIEQACGYTWKTLANAVFIDQQITRAFLGGTRSERTQVLTRFQNLERFETALKYVRKDQGINGRWTQEVESELVMSRQRLRGLKAEYLELEKRHKADLAELKEGMRKIEDGLEKAEHELETVKRVRAKQEKKLESHITSVNHSLSALDKEIGELNFERKQIMTWQKAASEAYQSAKCPTCWQTVDHVALEIMQRDWNKRLRTISQISSEKQMARAKKLKQQLLLEHELHQITQEVVDQQAEVRQWQLKKDFEHKKLVAFHNTENAEESFRAQKKRALRAERKRLILFKNRLEVSWQDKLFYEFAERAFSRDGIPAFLNRALAPILNRAAEYYSELFAEKAIQLRFEVVDGEFETQIVNATGGEDFEAQSAGEKALAGLIASFALREAAPKTNLLVLDEPGEGLDASSARRFAAGLGKLTGKFGSVYVITHNASILGELSGERTITVVKRNGVSRLLKGVGR